MLKPYKTCIKCDTEKLLSMFPARKDSKDGRRNTCNDCVNSYIAEWCEDNQEATITHKRKNKLKARFGLSIEEYDKKLGEQNGVCAICGTVCPTGRRLAVDHNHSTDKIRGLLCFECNIGLGKFKDSPELLDRAASYLIAYQEV